jgi:hypothetical protein
MGSELGAALIRTDFWTKGPANVGPQTDVSNPPRGLEQNQKGLHHSFDHVDRPDIKCSRAMIRRTTHWLIICCCNSWPSRRGKWKLESSRRGLETLDPAHRSAVQDLERCPSREGPTAHAPVSDDHQRTAPNKQTNAVWIRSASCARNDSTGPYRKPNSGRKPR